MPKKSPIDSRWTGFKSQKSGEFGELLVKAALLRLGLHMVEKVNVPWKVIFRGRRVVTAYPIEKVSGDFRAVEPSTGRSVLVEVKTNDNDTLPWSTFQPHQITALNDNHAAKGLSLIAWVREGQVYIMQWPQQGFGPGRSLRYSPELMEQVCMRGKT